MNTNKKVFSVTEKIPLDPFKEEPPEVTEKYFSAKEIEELESRPLKTKAGILAIKRALISVCRDLKIAGEFTEQSFKITHKKNGAPCISALPKLSTGSVTYTKKDFHISLSHNRDNAYGLAVVVEKLNG